jgi:beta-glucanase (GH16 family)
MATLRFESLEERAMLAALSIGNALLTEGTSGQSNMAFVISLDKPDPRHSISVTVTTHDGSAHAGTDYVAVNKSISFRPGQTQQTVLVPIIGDTLVEPRELFMITLSKASRASIADGAGAGVILDAGVNTPAPPPSGASGPAVPAPTGQQWALTFASEFNGTTATDLKSWNYESSEWGNSNGELQAYTSSTNNVFVSGGSLNLAAMAQKYTYSNGDSYNYTSGRINTQGLFSQAYGLFEFRAKMPTATGIWPALWLMPEDSVYGDWPDSGELDVMEAYGLPGGTTYVEGTSHSGSSRAGDTNNGAQYAPAGFDNTQWHTYDLQWSPGQLQWSVDGHVYLMQSTKDWISPNGNPNAPFDQPFYIIMNVAVGGDWLPTPNLLAGQSYTMQVDYVRVYQAQTAASGAALAKLNTIDETDLSAPSQVVGNNTSITNVDDLNRAAKVDATDRAILRLNATNAAADWRLSNTSPPAALLQHLAALPRQHRGLTQQSATADDLSTDALDLHDHLFERLASGTVIW